MTLSWKEKEDHTLFRDIVLARVVSKVRDRTRGAAAFTGSALAGVTARRFALGHRLAHQLEGALLGNESKRAEVLNGLLARGVLLTRNNAAVVLHEILLGKATRGMFRGSVKNLGFGANSGNV